MADRNYFPPGCVKFPTAETPCFPADASIFTATNRLFFHKNRLKRDGRLKGHLFSSFFSTCFSFDFPIFPDDVLLTAGIPHSHFSPLLFSPPEKGIKSHIHGFFWIFPLVHGPYYYDYLSIYSDILSCICSYPVLCRTNSQFRFCEPALPV